MGQVDDGSHKHCDRHESISDCLIDSLSNGQVCSRGHQYAASAGSGRHHAADEKGE
jgi:hypothetical protein